MNTLLAKPLCKGSLDSDTKEGKDEEVEEEDKNNEQQQHATKEQEIASQGGHVHHT